MRLLVTGGAGFIGSHLTEQLLHDGHQVTVLDDLSTGSLDNLAHLDASPALRVEVGSVLDEPLVDELVARVDAVFHLAAAVGVKLVLDRPLSSLRTNLRGTENVLDAAARHARRLILASTSEVYGKSERLPLREGDDQIVGSPYVARWLYANSKATNEFMAMAYWWEYRLPVTIVRFFNTVGPRQSGRYGMVVPRFVRQALAGEPLTVYDDGQQSRCFTYVGDAVRALIALLHAPVARTAGEVFNVGNTQSTTIEALAREVLRRTGSSSTLRYVPYGEAYGQGFADLRHRAPDITKLREMIGYAPHTPLVEILDRVIAHERAFRPREAAVSGLRTED
jgi:UDP-glucose 4-epimerase